MKVPGVVEIKAFSHVSYDERLGCYYGHGETKMLLRIDVEEGLQIGDMIELPAEPIQTSQDTVVVPTTVEATFIRYL